MTSLTAAVTRKGAKGEDLNQEERLSLREALGLYTTAAAAIVPTTATGQLTVGQSADFIVLSEDIFEEAAEKWPVLTVEALYLQGKQV